MICAHHWMISQMDYGRCKLCGLERDFKPAVDVSWGLTHKRIRKAVLYEKNLVTTGGFYLQGTLNRPMRNRFSPDWLE